MNYFSKVENFIQNINYTITYKNEKEGVFIATLDKRSLETTRTKLGFLKDKDVFTVTD